MLLVPSEDAAMKLRFTAAAAAVVVVAAWSLACGGGDPCNRLACEQCENKGAQMACEALVRSDNERACEVALTKPNFSTCQ
jgi:hypothetical protein